MNSGTRLSGEVTVDADPETVFAFVADPHNPGAIFPRMTVSEVHDTDVGKAGRYAYSLAGLTFEGRFRDVEREPPTRRRYETTGAFEGTVTWTVEPAEGGARVRYEQTVRLPGPGPVAALLGAVVRPFFRREVDGMLRRLAEQVG